jgi:hypothetical protein
MLLPRAHTSIPSIEMRRAVSPGLALNPELNGEAQQQAGQPMRDVAGRPAAADRLVLLQSQPAVWAASARPAAGVTHTHTHTLLHSTQTGRSCGWCETEGGDGSIGELARF